MAKLWLDLGNTRLKYWLMDGDTVLASDAREHLKAPNEMLIGLSDTFRRYRPEFIGVSSVLGAQNNQKIAKTLALSGSEVRFARVDGDRARLKSRYAADQLGVDRWLQMLGAPRADRLCVIGCGTALTVDLIDRGEHLGGYILPNVYMQRHALYAGTHQIAIKEGRFDSVDLGRTTFDAVNRGVLFAVVACVRTVRADYPEFLPILTGGGAQLIAAHAPFARVDPDLLLRGLRRYFGDCAFDDPKKT